MQEVMTASKRAMVMMISLRKKRRILPGSMVSVMGG
jgi:hypothetical protein